MNLESVSQACLGCFLEATRVMAALKQWRLAVVKKHVYTGAVFLVRNAESFFTVNSFFSPF
jgi:hypothetical protein